MAIHLFSIVLNFASVIKHITLSKCSTADLAVWRRYLDDTPSALVQSHLLRLDQSGHSIAARRQLYSNSPQLVATSRHIHLSLSRSARSVRPPASLDMSAYLAVVI